MTLLIALMLIYGFGLHWSLYVIAPMLWMLHLCLVGGSRTVNIRTSNKSTRSN